MSTATISISAEELSRNPPEKRCELVRGELIFMSPAGSSHGWVTMNISVPIGSYVKTHKLGYAFGAETGFLIERDPDTVRAPDVSFVRKSRMPDTPAAGFFPGAPDLAVEVLSPGDSASEVQEKTEAWLQAGCCEVWLIDPRRKTAMVCELRNDAVVSQSVQRLSTELLPGFSLEVSTLFE